MSKAMATAWAKDNIQVNAHPAGWIDTALKPPGSRADPGLARVGGLSARRSARWGVPTTFGRHWPCFWPPRASDFCHGRRITVDGAYSSRVGLGRGHAQLARLTQTRPWAVDRHADANAGPTSGSSAFVSSTRLPELGEPAVDHRTTTPALLLSR